LVMLMCCIGTGQELVRVFGKIWPLARSATEESQESPGGSILLHWTLVHKRRTL
jgi:hypothetical protein